MKSYWLNIAEGQTSVELRDTAQPAPGPRQALVRVRAASLNRGELFAAHGLHKAGAPKAMGMEAAGEVVACGEGMSVKVGDAVMGRCGGSFAEYVLMDEREVMLKPASLSWEEAASIPLTYLVVYDMVVQQGRLKAGEWVLINGVSSGVGVAALQLARALGAKVIGTSGSQAKLDRIKGEGLDLGLCTRKADFHDEVMAATGGKGVDLVINTVGGSVFAENIRCMAFEGRLATVGYVDGQMDAVMDIQALHSKRLTLFGVSNKLRTPEQRASGVPGFRKDVLPLFASGTMRPVIDTVYPFEQLAAAKAHMESNTQLGKIVLAGRPD